jgi:hypothetical protein
MPKMRFAVDESCSVSPDTIARIANPTGMRVTQLLLEVESVLAATDVRDLAEAVILADDMEKQKGGPHISE